MQQYQHKRDEVHDSLSLSKKGGSLGVETWVQKAGIGQYGGGILIFTYILGCASLTLGLSDGILQPIKVDIDEAHLRPQLSK